MLLALLADLVLRRMVPAAQVALVRAAARAVRACRAPRADSKALAVPEAGGLWVDAAGAPTSAAASPPSAAAAAPGPKSSGFAARNFPMRSPCIYPSLDTVSCIFSFPGHSYDLL